MSIVANSQKRDISDILKGETEVVNLINNNISDKSKILYILENKHSNKNISKIFNSNDIYKYTAIVCTRRLNNFKHINKLLEKFNSKLINGGYIFTNIEDYKQRKARILTKTVFPINKIIYVLDCIFNRIIPKFSVSKRLYFKITNSRFRAISKMETYGRLLSCGFELVETCEINGIHWFVGKKVGLPEFNYEATYGPLIKLKRYGKNNKIINIYKLRTMYPYSEYLQSYVSSHYGLQKGGKFKKDPRITAFGRLLRKYWIDELPMVINVIKGDIKLVGVRPLSIHYFSLYPKYMQKLRAKFKPGLVPPFYVDMPETLEEIYKSEEKYLKAYEKKPLITDIKYLFKAIHNILFKSARSH